MSKEKKNKKLVFGRNSFTLIFICSILAIIALVAFTINSYVSCYNNNLATEFVSGSPSSSVTDVDKAIHLDAKDFKEFNIKFTCTEYSEDSLNSKFEVRTWKNENTKTLKGEITAQLCLKADWVGFCNYSSSVSSMKLAETKESAEKSSTYLKTFTVKLIDFPAKANCFPIPVTVNEPQCYLYLKYSYYSGGKTATDIYILKYEYQDFIKGVSGGIIK